MTTIARLLALSAVLLLAGCTPAPSPPAASTEVPDAIAQREIDCRAPGNPWLENAPAMSPQIPEPGRVPAGFEPVAALLCTADADFEGQPTIQVERYEGDLEPLLAALAEPDDTPTPGFACAAYAELIQPLWLEGSTGRLISVRWPVDACAHTQPEAHDALTKLELVETTELR